MKCLNRHIIRHICGWQRTTHSENINEKLSVMQKIVFIYYIMCGRDGWNNNLICAYSSYMMVFFVVHLLLYCLAVKSNVNICRYQYSSLQVYEKLIWIWILVTNSAGTCGLVNSWKEWPLGRKMENVFQSYASSE